MTEAHRHYPVNLNVISWLGVWYVKREMYEQAIEYFERAAVVQPSEAKWRYVGVWLCVEGIDVLYTILYLRYYVYTLIFTYDIYFLYDVLYSYICTHVTYTYKCKEHLYHNMINV